MEKFIVRDLEFYEAPPPPPFPPKQLSQISTTTPIFHLHFWQPPPLLRVLLARTFSSDILKWPLTFVNWPANLFANKYISKEQVITVVKRIIHGLRIMASLHSEEKKLLLITGKNLLRKESSMICLSIHELDK